MILKKFYLIILFSLPLCVIAQNNSGSLSLDLSGGANYSYGDINSLWGPTGDLGLKYSISDQFGLKGNFRGGLLRGGEDQYNREFENQYFQYSLRGVFNISQLTNLHKTLPKINLLAFGGVGQIHNNGEDTRDDYPEGEEPRPDNTGSSLVYPFGGGVKFYLSQRLDLNLNVNYTYANSDNIDNFNASTPGNRFNDGYASYSLGLTYKFGSSSGDHKEWEQEDYDKQIEDLEKKQKQRLNSLKSEVDKLQTLISSNSLATWENEAELNRLEDKIDEAGKGVKKIEKEKDKKEVKKGKDEKEAETEETKTIRETEKKVVKRKGLSNKRFINVIGSFKNKDKAIQFAKEIEEKGDYKPGVLFNYYKGWYYVHVNKNENMAKARKSLKETKKDLGINDAWIYFRSADDLEKYRNR